MIMPFKRNRTSRLRFIRAYLLIILACTLLIFCLSIIILYQLRQNEKAQSSRDFRDKWVEKMPVLEDRIQTLAADFLRQPNMQEFAYPRGTGDSLEELRALREYFKTLKEEHSIAQYLFILDGTQLIFPRLKPPPPQSLSSLTLGTPPEAFRIFSQQLHEGELREIQFGQPVEAAQIYARAEKLEVAPRLKALALSRRARALTKAHLKAAAVEAYRALLETYGEQRDEYQVPYVLVLTALPEELVQSIFPSTTRSLDEIYRNLTSGKWELSADQAEAYSAKLELRLKPSIDTRRNSDYMEHFEAARAVSRELALGQQPQASEIEAQPIEYKNVAYQTYRISMPGKNGRNRVVALSVSMQWINQFLVPPLLKDIDFEMVNASVVDTLNPGYKDNSGEFVDISLANGLPYWKLRIPTESIQTTEITASRDSLFVMLSIVMLLSVLGLGLFLFIRVSFHIRWDQLRSDFVSGVSHEFKTPLSLIRLYSETLANNDQDYAPEDRRNYIRIIARESERMSRLIDNVLDFSKMEQGRNLHEMQEGDLAVPVSQAISDYSDYLTWRGFSVKSSIWPQLPPVRFNREQVAQMVLNLLDNARKYSGMSRRIRVNVWVQEGEVVVEVQDNGPGIAAEEIEKIFQPFYRIAKGSEKGGCGLGLYLVDQVMKEHGGRVEVESVLNQGSSFRLIFPISGADREASRKRSDRTFTRARDGHQVQDFT